MTVALEKLRRILFLETALAFVLSIAFGTILWWALNTYTGLDPKILIFPWLLALSILSGYLSMSIAQESVFALNYVTQAILHVAREDSTVEAPSPKNLRHRYHFLDDIAGRVYDIASTHSQDAPTKKIGRIPDLAQIAVPAIAVASDNTIVYANPAASHYFSIEINDMLDKNLYDVLRLSFSSLETLDDWLVDCRANKITESHSWERVRHTLAGGDLRQFDMVSHFSKNNPSGFDTLLVIVDHTSRYSQEDRDVGFVAMAVHELRTPLTSMRGYLEVFEDELADKLSDEQRTFMHNMNAQADQLADFVSNILDVARVEENQLHLKLHKEDWRKVVEQSIKDMSLRASVGETSIMLKASQDVPAVAVDRVVIGEVLSNLLDNAIKYTHNHAPIVVDFRLTDNNMVETTITDQGVGIPANVMGHLFKKFYRSHRSSQVILGTGIGLYLTKAIVVAHGGDIWVKSKEGQGTTFGFTVPTYDSVAKNLNEDDNEITREAHGWIKNHSLYRN